jgi:signal peptidase I
VESLPPGAADPVLAAAAAHLLVHGEGLPAMDRLLAGIAAARPATGFELARAVEAAAPGLLDRHEGGIYPVLAGLVRRGDLEARWEEAGPGRVRRVYGPPGFPEERPASRAPAAEFPRSLGAAAASASREVPGAFDREAARAEMLAHLEEAAAAYGALGLAPAAAAEGALRDFGDPWKVRTDLGRVHRGRPVLVYPRTFSERARSFLLYDGPPLAVVVAVLLLVRWQVVQAYNIPTKSMEPTLHGEDARPDFILVDKTAYLRREPERFEIAVFYPPTVAGREREEDAERFEDRSAFVKRIVGIGPETLEFRGGDVVADGVLRRRPPAVEDAMMVPLYDLAADVRELARRSRLAPVGSLLFDESWAPREGRWGLESGGMEAYPGPGGEARVAFLRDLNNSYAEPDGYVAIHGTPAGDLEARLLATAEGPATAVGIDLLEGAGDGEERHRLRLGPGGMEVASGELRWTLPSVRLPAGRPAEIRFRNVDDRLTAWVDGERVLHEDLPERAVRPKEPARGGVELVVLGGRARLSRVRILRDIVYTDSRNTSGPRTIPAGTLFMCGDNTGNSHDSRVWGPVDRDDLVGSPFWIVWPPARAKVLR